MGRWILDLRNSTPYPHVPALLHDERGHEVFVVLLKAGFRLSDGSLHPDPLPVYVSDVLCASGAVRYPADLVPSKEGTDIVCHGSVFAPGGEPVSSCRAELRVGDVRAAVRAFGRRWWRRDGSAWRISDPEPLRSVALGMERAFGGRGDPRNPAGLGVFEEASGPLGVELPQLETDEEAMWIKAPGDRPAPAGFAAVAPHWEPRRSYRGTYGEAWERERAPLLPVDMAARFWNAGQVTSARPLVGGEPIELVNLTAAGRLERELPRVGVRAVIDGQEVRPALDLVVLEPDIDRVSLTFRVAVDVTGRLDGRTPKVHIIEKRRMPLGGRYGQ